MPPSPKSTSITNHISIHRSGKLPGFHFPSVVCSLRVIVGQVTRSWRHGLFQTVPRSNISCPTQFLCCVIYFCFDVFIKMIRVINFKLMKAEMSSHGLCARLTAFYCLRDRRRIWISTICLQDCFFHPHAELFYLHHSVCVRAHSLTLFWFFFFNLLILTFLLRVHFWLTLVAFDKILLPYMRCPPSVIATLYHRPSTIL